MGFSFCKIKKKNNPLPWNSGLLRNIIMQTFAPLVSIFNCKHTNRAHHKQHTGYNHHARLMTTNK